MEKEAKSPLEADPLSLTFIRNQLAQNESNAAAILRSVIHSDRYAASTASFKGQDALDFIEMLDNASFTSNLGLGASANPVTQAIDTTYYAETDLFQEFRRLCGRAGLLPSSHMLLGQLTKSGDQPIASGSYCKQSVSRLNLIILLITGRPTW